MSTIPQSTTPRTDAAVRLTIGAGFNMVYPSFARELETELAATQAERDLAITRVASILWSGAIDKHTCGDVQKWVDDYTAELAHLRAEVERLKKDTSDMGTWVGSKMLQPEWDSFKQSLEVIEYWKTRAELAEASAKLWEADALRYANNTEFWKARAEKAEAALQKILNVMREDSNGKDPMDAVEDIIIATKEAIK